MLKKITLAFVAVLIASRGYSGPHYPDVCKVAGEDASILCAGLIEHFELSQVSDSDRWGAGMSYLQEAPGTNVAMAVDNGINVADFDGSATKWLWANVTAPSDSFSIALRVNVKTLPASGNLKYVLSWYNTNFVGPNFYYHNNAGTGRFCYLVREAEEATTTRSVCQNATAAAWHFVTFGASRFHDGKANIWISVDNAARTTTAVTYWQQGGPPYLRVGGLASTGPIDSSQVGGTIEGTDMYLAKLDLFARPISNYEQTLLYNSSAAPSGALAFPYDTN